MTKSSESTVFATALWGDGEQSLELGGVRVALSGDEPGSVRLQESEPGELLLSADRPTRALLRIDAALGDAVGYWHPQGGWSRTLPADWSGWRKVSLVHSAPVGCLYDSSGVSRFAFAADCTVRETPLRFGVSEELARFGVWLSLDLGPSAPVRLRISTEPQSVAAALRAMRDWYAVRPGYQPLPVPEFGREPVYSTWYSFTQDVTAVEVEAEAAVAAELGCGQLFLDDGWQQFGTGRGYAGCGDWIPDPAKFPDFAAHVARVRALGLRYTAWVSPLLLGERSAAYRELRPYAEHCATRLQCQVLDPRHRAVREHVVATCVRVVRDYGLDGLKVDFLDEAMVYADGTDTPDATGEGWIADVGTAMAALLGALREALHRLRGDEFTIELRQTYIGPAMTQYGNLLRAGDCPSDAVANRIRTLDVALLSPGGAVHSDMLLWDPDAAPEALARQFHGALHSVPQISMRLTRLPAEHRETLAFWLARWRELRPALTGGRLEPGRPDELYPTVVASADGEQVVTCYAERVVRLSELPGARLTLINSTSADRVVLDVTAPAPAQVPLALEVRDARGRVVHRGGLQLTEGLNAVPVPPFGLGSLSRTDAP
ncbi:glycoside hydrolase family 36 protein [Streptacidiphilus sp. EB129]|uniref:glycoside hydrolase family 36 protein n=1 Tax=Streptacidiphilus sp. EB129 TaxID=3156262 RepID=UPI003515B71F